MPQVSLIAKSRSHLGKGAARKSRVAGEIPAVLYGPGEEPQPVSVTQPDFMKIYHGGHGENVCRAPRSWRGRHIRVRYPRGAFGRCH